MYKKVYLRDLECYKSASDEMKQHPLFSPDRCFDFEQLAESELTTQLEAYLQDRGTKLSPLSIRSELYPFNLLCRFLKELCPDLGSFGEIAEDDLVKKAKIWLLKNGKNLTQKRKKITSGKTEVTDSDLIKYIRKIYRYLQPVDDSFKFEDDRWHLDNIPLKLKVNPTKAVRSITFEKIVQPKIREEVKKVIYIHLSSIALGTVCAELTAINRFSRYLSDRYPKVESLTDIDRELFEQYLIHTNTEATGRKSYSKELCHLRSLFITAGKVLENRELENIFYQDDIGKVPVKLYKVYSDDELKRLNAVIVEGEEQVARALFLHQLLGTRISDTLTLRQNAVREGENGSFFIRIQQVKTGKSYEKAINTDVKALFEKACEYTNERYGIRDYVFVNDKQPDIPMQYGRIQYQLMAMIQKNDLRDDKGELFGVGTHIWRHCYGKRLTEMHIDDATVAKLLGHANTSSLKYYRRIGTQMLADETREMRENMDSILKGIINEWV